MGWFDKKSNDEYLPAQADDQEDVMMPAGVSAEPVQTPQAAEQPPVVMVPQRTVLSEGTKVKGDVISKESMSIDGTVEGNVTCAKQVTISGTVVGNVKCESFALTSGCLKGNLQCSGAARVAEESMMEGNVEAQEFSLGGTLRGDAQVTGLASLFSVKAHMEGDLTAGKISIAEGATMFGKVEMIRPKEEPAPKKPTQKPAPQPEKADKPQEAPAAGANAK